MLRHISVSSYTGINHRKGNHCKNKFMIILYYQYILLKICGIEKSFQKNGYK
jgi:hypothetical protein